jgi:DNA repair photolyase
MSNIRWLTPATGYLSGYTHTLNPYTGCSFGCSYCYVRRLPVALFRGEPWGAWAEPKKGDPQRLQDELKKAKSKGSVTVFFSSATDPYQPLEASVKLTRSLLEVMAEEPPDFVLLQTRSPLVVRDLDLLRKLDGRIRVSMTVESDREDVRRQLTPSTPPIAARMSALRQLREAGIATQAAVSPLLPHTPMFARLLADAAPRIVVDDYFRGDGSGGKRSRSLGMPAMYEQAGWGEWYSPNAADAFLKEVQSLLSPGATGFSVEGFAPPS